MRIKYDRTYRLRIYILVIISGLIYISSVFTNKNNTKDVIEMMNTFYSSDIFSVVLPAIVSVLSSDICFDDITSNSIYFQLQRKNRNYYILNRIFETLVISAIYVFASFLLYNIISVALTKSVTGYISASSSSLNNIEILLRQLVHSFVLSAVWGLTGSVFSLLLSNKSGGFVFPFVLNYLLGWIKSNYIQSIEFLDSKFWMDRALLLKETYREDMVVFLTLVLFVVSTAYYAYVFVKISRKE